jgi:hypothetical protein
MFRRRLSGLHKLSRYSNCGRGWALAAVLLGGFHWAAASAALSVFGHVDLVDFLKNEQQPNGIGRFFNYVTWASTKTGGSENLWLRRGFNGGAWAVLAAKAPL